MRSSAATRRKSRALFGLAREADAVEDTRRELGALAEVFDESAELRNSIFRPLHPVAERRAVLVALCQHLGSSALVRNFYAFLVDQRRLVDFDGIRADYDRLADEAAGRVHAQVTSASPLADDQRDRLRRALAQRTGKEIELEVSVDPTLLGGAIATVGGLVFDGSLRTQLRQLRTSLTRGH